MKRNLRVIKALIKLRFQKLMMFRLGFFGPFFVDGSLFLIQLMVFKAIYSNVEKIGDWNQGNMIVFIGTFSLVNAVNMSLYFFGVNAIPEKIRSGEMDLYLSKPVSPLLRFTFEQVNPGSIPLVVLSIFIILYGVRMGGISVNKTRVLGYLICVGIMIILYYELEIIIRSLAFFFISSDGVIQIEESGLSLCMQLPGTVFYGAYRVVFYYFLPYGIISTFPSLLLTGGFTGRMAVHGLAVFICFTLLTGLIWKAGLKHYDSINS